MNGQYERDAAGRMLKERENAALFNCIARLDALLDREERLIQSGWPFDLDAINNLKVHLLLEFSRVSRNITLKPSPQLEARLRKLNERATKNAFMLEQYFCAMQEISRLMIEHAKMDDSDGTYSRRSASWRHERGD